MYIQKENYAFPRGLILWFSGTLEACLTGNPRRHFRSSSAWFAPLQLIVCLWRASKPAFLVLPGSGRADGRGTENAGDFNQILPTSSALAIKGTALWNKWLSRSLRIVLLHFLHFRCSLAGITDKWLLKAPKLVKIEKLLLKMCIDSDSLYEVFPPRSV